MVRFRKRFNLAGGLLAVAVTLLIVSLSVPLLALAKDSKEAKDDKNVKEVKKETKKEAKKEVVDIWRVYQHDTRHTGQSDYKGPRVPDILWVVPFGDTGKPSTAMVVDKDGSFYVGMHVTPAEESTTTETTEPKASGHSGVFAFDKDRKVKWVSKVSGEVKGPIALGEGDTVFAVIGNDLAALSKKNGSAKWQVQLNSESTGGVVVDGKGNIYVTTSAGKSLYAVSGDGEVEWVYTAEGEIDSSPAIGSDGTVYFTANDLCLYAVGPDGDLKWKFKVTENGTDKLSAPALGEDDTVYFGSSRDDGYIAEEDQEIIGREYLYAVGPDGKLKWQFQARGKKVSMPAVRKDGVVIFATTSINYTENRDYELGDCFVQAVDRDGEWLWDYDSPDNDVSGPVLLDRDGYVYVSSDEGHMTCISGRGTMVWRAKVGGMAIIGQEGTLYVSAKSSVATVIDKSLSGKEQSGEKIKEQLLLANASRGPLAYLVYILPFFAVVGVGYYLKSKADAKREEKQDGEEQTEEP